MYFVSFHLVVVMMLWEAPHHPSTHPRGWHAYLPSFLPTFDFAQKQQKRCQNSGERAATVAQVHQKPDGNSHKEPPEEKTRQQAGLGSRAPWHQSHRAYRCVSPPRSSASESSSHPPRMRLSTAPNSGPRTSSAITAIRPKTPLSNRLKLRVDS